MKTPITTLAICLFALSFAGTALGQSWTQRPPKPNNWVNYTACVAEQGGENQIFCFGGVSAITTESDVYRYHRTLHWSGPLAPMPAPRAHATSAAGLNASGDQRIYVFGGNVTVNTTEDQVWAYDPINDLWETGFTPMPTARRDARAVNGNDGWIYVFGGFTGTSGLTAVERYDPATDVWEILAPMASPRSSFGASLACDGLIYLTGGETGSGLTWTTEVFRPDGALGGYFLANNPHTASPCAPMPYLRSDFGMATARNGQIYVVGGTFGSLTGTDSVVSYNPWTNTWSDEPVLPTSRRTLEVVGLGSRIWALGGYSKPWNTAKLEAFGGLWLTNSCSGIVPAFANNPWGDIAQCVKAFYLELDDEVFDVGVIGGASQWLKVPVASGEILEARMANGAGDQGTRLTLWDKCGGQVLGASHDTGIPGEQVLEYQNESGAPMELLVEMTWSGAPDDVLEFDFGLRRYYDSIGQSYCGPAVPNSSGLSAEIIAVGDTSVYDNDFSLQASDLPTNQFGYFLASQTQAFIQGPGGSQGNLCIGGNIARFVKQVGGTGSTGTLEIEVDLLEIPASPQGPVLPGETWNFQAWVRDMNPNGTSNFTDAVSVTFN